MYHSNCIYPVDLAKQINGLKKAAAANRSKTRSVLITNPDSTATAQGSSS